MSDKPDLEASEARLRALTMERRLGVTADLEVLVDDDVPALLAEVQRLRDELEAEIASHGVAERDADFANAMRTNEQLEARVRGLEAENAALRRQVGELCPVGDLDTITSLRAEIALLQEQVARYKRLYDGVYGMLCGESLHRTVAEFTSQPAWVREYLGVYSGEGATAEGALGLEEGSDG